MISLLLMAFFGLFSCQGSQERALEVKEWMNPNGKIKVLSTIAMINDIVKRIGGEYVDAHTLIIGELNPHSYQLVKGDDEKFRFADLIFFNGLNLEHGPSLKKILYEKSNAIGLGDLISKEYPELILQLNGQTDPHIWMDVALWEKIIPHIVKALQNKDPIHTNDYTQNAKLLSEELQSVHKEIEGIMHAVPAGRRYLVTSHDAFNYFARAYLAEKIEMQNNTWSKRFQAPEGLAPDSQLSSIDIYNIIEHLAKYNIEVIFPESNVSQDSIKKIVDASSAKGINVRIASCHLFADAMGRKGEKGDTYTKMIRHNAELIAYYLNPTSDGLKIEGCP
jgi:manganese/zinc/iron transport system substrate-binding protein